MADETPDPEASAPDAPASAADGPTEPVDTPSDAPTASTGPPTGDRPGVFVPRWLAVLVGLVLVVGLIGGAGFWLGRETADDDGPRGEQAARPFEPRQVPSTPPVPSEPRTPDIPNLPQTPQGRQLLGVAVEDGDGGATVVRVTGGSPADDAGLEVGDVITEVDGDAIEGAADLVAAIRSHESGDEIRITYERDGESTTVPVTLADVSSGSTTS